MTVLSAGSLTNLRTKRAEATLYLSVHQPTTLLAAQVNGAHDRGARSIAYDTGSGALFSLAEAGQTLEVDTATGTEKVRIKSISGTAASGTIVVGENDIIWANNQDVRIKHNYELWPIPPTIRGGVFYKDYDIAYSAQNSQPNPVAIAGSHQAVNLSGASVSITIPSASSYGFNGATISSRTCTVAPSAGVTVTPSGSNFTIEFTATGQYWVKLSVTDSNSKIQDTYRLVFVHGTGYAPCTDFSVGSIGGDWETGGWRFQVAINGDVDLSEFPDGSIAVLWYDNRLDDSTGFVDVFGTNSQQIICAGYLRSDNNTDNLNDGTGLTTFEITTVESLMDAMTDFGSVSIGAVTSPAKWYEGPSWMHVGFGVHHELRWHSTVMQCVDVFGMASTPLGVKNIDFTEGSIYQRVNGIAWQRGILSKVVSNRLGQLYLVGDTQMLNTSGRAALDTVFSITDADLSEDVNIPRQPEPQNAVTDMNGFSYTHPTSSPFISIIPGYRESSISFAMPEFRGTGSAMFGSQVVASQTDMNEKIGRVHAVANNPLSEIRMNFRSNYLGAFDIVPSLGWYTVGLSNGDFKRGLSLNGKKMICRSITHSSQFEDGYFNGVILTSAIFEVEAQGPDGIQGNYPTSFPAPVIPLPEGVPEAAVGGNAIIAFSDPTDGSKGKAIVAQIGSVTLGSVEIFDSASSTWISVAHLSATKVIVCYRNSVNRGVARVLDISGTTITVGAAAEFETNATDYIDVIGLSATKAIVCYRNATVQGTARILDVSGSTITPGLGANFNGSNSIYISVDRISATKAIVTYRNADTFPYGAILDVSGSTITANTPVNIFGSAASYTGVAALDSSNALVTYIDAFNVLKLSLLTSITTTFTVSDTENLDASRKAWDNHPGTKIIQKLDATHAVVGYQTSISPFRIWAIAVEVSGASIAIIGTSIVLTDGTGSYDEVPAITAINEGLVLLAFDTTADGRARTFLIDGVTITDRDDEVIFHAANLIDYVSAATLKEIL